MSMSPLSILINCVNTIEFLCVICDAEPGECDCWQKCECGWTYEKLGKCSNPIHK
jgi:hypothetical protein